MKKVLGLTVLFIFVACVLTFFGDGIVQFGRETLPLSWVAQSPDSRTVSLRTYGMDQFLQRSLFGPLDRRVLFLMSLGFYAVICLIVLQKILRGTALSAVPRWGWIDGVWVFIGVMIFWELIPAGVTLQTGSLLLKDAAVGIWILALGRSRGLGLRDLGISPEKSLKDTGLGIVSALLLAPALAVLVLIQGISAGPSFIPTDLTLPAPTSLASAWLAVLFLPFFEELLFRGFLYRLLRGRWPEILANLAVSLLFAAIHGSPISVGLARFLGSVLMCRLFERTGTLWSSLGAHASFNAILLLGPAVF